MMKRHLNLKNLASMLLVTVASLAYAQTNTNTTCAEALPVCPDNNFGRNIVSEVGDDLSGEVGPDYGCNSTQPNPLWYYFRVSQSGTAIFDLEQWTGMDQTGDLIDVDFTLWGPFDSEDNCDNLTEEMVVDSSYDPTGDETIDFYNGDGCGAEPTENAQFVNAGEVYILVITNFSRRAGYINLIPREEMTATFDCSILGPSYEFCDIGGDGQENVNLDDYVLEISEGDPDVGITFHTTSQDAYNYIDPLPSQQILTTDALTVYARKENYVTGAVEVVVITFALIPEPELQEDTITFCDNNGDGTEIFDLTDNNIIVEGQEQEITLTYHTSQEDADTGANPIEDPTYYTSGTADIYVRGEAGDCFATSILHLVLIDTIELVDAETAVCDADGDGTETFNLNDFSDEILNGNSGTIQFYENEADAIAGNDNFIQNPDTYATGSTVLYAFVAGNGGCNATAQLTITVNESPQLNEITVPYSFCDNGNDGTETVDLTVAFADLVENTAGLTATYFLTEADALNNNTAAAIANPAAYDLTADTTVYVRVSVGDCFDVGAVTFELTDGIPVTNDTLFACFAENGQGTFDLTTAEVANVATITYHTNESDALTGNAPIGNPASYTTSVPGTVYVHVADGECVNTAEIELAFFDAPVIPLENEYSLCSGQTETIDLGTGFSNINWSTGDTSSSITLSELGNYWVDVTDANGCTYRHEFTVVSGISPNIVSVDEGQNNLVVNAEGGVEPYQYSLGGFIWQDSNDFGNLNPGTYNIYVRGADGCVSSVEIASIFSWPTLFTPNGDGINDTFRVPGLEVYPGSNIRIFDRYGALVFEGAVNGNVLWDGSDMAGNKVSTQDYWYILDVGDGRRINGHVTVKNRTEKGR